MHIDVTEVQRLTNKLVDMSLRSADPESIFNEVCVSLNAAGFQLMRGHAGHRTLHPQFRNASIQWYPDKGVETRRFLHANPDDNDFLQSTIHFVFQHHIPELRLNLAKGEGIEKFPFMQELKDEGATDYVCFLSDWGEKESDGGMVSSYATSDPGGFTEEAMDQLRRVNSRVSLAFKTVTREEMARNIAATYLGKTAGQRVIDGSIRKGDGERIDAVIVYIDMRGSTAMADTLPAEVYLSTLHAFFEAKAAPILDEGGEILAYMGDAILGIFPYCTEEVGLSKKEACEAAIRAMIEADDRLYELNQNRIDIGLSPLKAGSAFHVGELLYGNIGVTDRLQFTVIGPAANEAARLEGLTKQFDMPVIASGTFAEEVGLPWSDLGLQCLRGVERNINIFGLTEDWCKADPGVCLKQKYNIGFVPREVIPLSPKLVPSTMPEEPFAGRLQKSDANTGRPGNTEDDRAVETA